jgi:LysR family transcriptional regulator, transcription activator of glutamate synthase operon
MELRQLKYFIAVAEALHFGRASEKLNITASALSQQVHLLEDELGVDLFDKAKRMNFRRVELTKVGIIFLEEAKKTIQQSEIAIEKAQNAPKKGISLRFGVFRTILPERIEKIMELASATFPHIQIQIVELPTSRLVQDGIFNDTIDFGLSSLPLAHDNLEGVIYDETYFGVLMNKNHPLSNKNEVTFEELNNEKWIDYGKDVNPYYELIEIYCKKAGFSRKNSIQQIVPSIELLKRWINLSKGIAFVPISLDVSQEKDMSIKKIINDDGSPFTSIVIQPVIVYKKKKSIPAIEELAKMVALR